LGYPVFELSSKSGAGVDELRKRIEGRTVVFCGLSGVGKTSLLRKLLVSDIGRVAEISHSTGKGRHTTTGAILLGGPSGSQWIDTPGIREFGLSEVPPARLAECFPEFQKLHCAVSGCLHQDEEGCVVRTLARHASYRRILESLLAGEN
jgi:ribosome biogenesis GTPase